MTTLKPRPLTDYPAQSLVRVAGLDADCAARGRLCALGLVPGTRLTIVSQGPGPLRLLVRNSDLVLGRGLAEKVLALPASAPLDLDEKAAHAACGPCRGRNATCPAKLGPLPDKPKP